MQQQKFIQLHTTSLTKKQDPSLHRNGTISKLRMFQLNLPEECTPLIKKTTESAGIIQSNIIFHKSSAIQS